MKQTVKVGIFYDGGWWTVLSDYLAETHQWRARPTFGGLADVMAWHLERSGLGEVEVAEQHYVRGRFGSTSSRSFDIVLQESGVQRHDAPTPENGAEKGADVLFALNAFDRATAAPLDAVVLQTGDADFIPLAQILRGRGRYVIVPSVAVRDGGVDLNTAPRLKAAADSAPDLIGLLAAALKREAGYAGVYPFVEPVATTPPVLPPSGDYLTGAITRWREGEPYGFITSSTGGSFFVSRDVLPPGKTRLPEGTRVQFKGRPKPMPGKKYPEAFSVRPVE
ncbi:NYN domain-containing protein [Microbispora sp. NPDC049125]|uniref:NYN domain-containing protein n=1 Tax=Microbispora sp. NPDC049125 TaxID=3154929 RepID=UPI00346756FA